MVKKGGQKIRTWVDPPLFGQFPERKHFFSVDFFPKEELGILVVENDFSGVKSISKDGCISDIGSENKLCNSKVKNKRDYIFMISITVKVD